MALNVIDRLNKIPLWQKAVGVFLVALGIPVAFYFMSWQPLDLQIVQVSNQQLELERRYKEQKAVADDLVTFQQNTKKLEEDLKVALTQLPQDKEIPTLLRDIYTLGKKSGISFRNFQPMPEISKSMYVEIPIRLSMSGTYHEVAVFFDRVGKLSRIVNISELQMQATKVESDSDTPLTIDCIATTFMFAGGRK